MCASMCVCVCACVCVSLCVYTVSVLIYVCVHMFHMTWEFTLHADYVVQSDDLLNYEFSCESL